MSSSGLRSGRRRQRTGQNACIDLTVDIGGDEVIDLTHYHHSNIMDSPIVILSPDDDVGGVIRRRRRGTGRRLRLSPSSGINMPSSSRAGSVDVDNSDDVHEGAIIRRRMGSGRRGLRRSHSNRRLHQESAPTSSPSINTPSSSSAGPVDLVNSDDELPDIPFHIPALSSQANASYLQSPALKISCPVCLDDVKQIRSSNRRIMSTICGHIFCEECITSAIRSLRSCPSCRKSLSLAKIHPIFL